MLTGVTSPAEKGDTIKIKDLVKEGKVRLNIHWTTNCAYLRIY